MDSLEWTGSQQLILLAQSSGLGVELGLLFSVWSGCFRLSDRRVRFVADMLFGLVAALITFFMSLAMMDGRLHPLLFFGSGVGFAATYIAFGWRLARLIGRCRGWLHRGCSWLTDRAEMLLAAFYRIVSRQFSRLFHSKSNDKKDQNEKNAEKNEKSRKKFCFFQKKA